MLLLLAALLLAAAAIASVWYAASLGLPPWTTLALAVAAASLFSLFVLMLIVRRLRRMRRRRRSPTTTKSEDPSIDALGHFIDGELSRVREAAEDARYSLLLGPTGAGKSAALLSAGLVFRDGFRPDRLLAGGTIQATDRASFYITDGASPTVFVDTSGRYVDGTSADEREWGELLRRLPNTAALSGVVVVVDAAPLIAGEAPGVALRRRVDELQLRLGVCFPVYVIIAKVDALVGLERLAALLGIDALGLDLEVDGPGAKGSRGVVERELSVLREELAAATTRRLSTMKDTGARGEVLRSIAALDALAEATLDLVAVLFPDHGGEDAPILRAISWGFADGALRRPQTPIDPLAEDCAARCGGRPAPAPTPAPLGDDMSMRRAFARVLDDPWISRRSRGWVRRQRRRALATTAGWTALCVAFAFAFASAAKDNQRLLGHLLGAYERASLGPSPAAASPPAVLAPLAEISHTLEDQATGGAPWSLRWGMYQGEAVREAAMERYHRILARRVIAPIVAAKQAELTRVSRRSRSSANELGRDEYWSVVDDLRLYLALTRYDDEREGARDHDGTWLAEAFAEAWGSLADARPDPTFSAAVVSRDLPALVRGGDALPVGDPVLVERVRQLLRRTARGRLFVDEVGERGIGGEAIRVATFAPAATWLRNNDRRIRPAFTGRGWGEVLRILRCDDEIVARYVSAAAVIDDSGCDEELMSLRGDYLAAYIREWNQFLDTMHVAEPEGYEAIRAQIEDMTITGGPSVNALEALFAIVADNAVPRATPHAAEQSWIRKYIIPFPSRTVRLALEPFYRYGVAAPAQGPTGEPSATALQAYFAALMRISGPLDEYARTQDAAHLEQARKYAGDVFTLLSEDHLPKQDTKWRPVLQRLTEPPIRGLLEEVRRGESDQLTQRWCNEVYLPFEAMKICYPFTEDGACNASASEVAELFHPTDGALWQLYGEALAGRFPFKGDRYEVALQGYGSRLKLNPKVAELLTHAKELGDVLFPGGAAAPTFAFSIHFQPSTTASKLRLVVDGSTLEYNNNHNDDFRPLSWPGEGGPPGAELVASIRGGEQRVQGEGLWGLFKLLEKGDVHQEQRFIRVNMRVGEAKDVSFILNPESGLGTPLFGRLRPDARLMDVFREPRLRVPSALFLGGMRCASR